MSIASASTVQYGRRKGSSKNVRSAEERAGVSPQVDLHQVTVLPRSDWLRIQDSLNHVNKQRESLMAAARQREALHLHSKEVVKGWTNTLATHKVSATINFRPEEEKDQHFWPKEDQYQAAPETRHSLKAQGQRQKRLEAKKLREEAEEEERKRIDIEEAQYQEEKRKEAIEKAKTLLYYHSDRVKGFHSSLLLTEVLKEREAQIELKKRKQMASKDLDEEILAMIQSTEARALELELQKAVLRKEECLATAQSLKQQMKEHEEVREQERMIKEKEAEELQQLQELRLKEQSIHEEKKQTEKRSIMRAHQEHMTNRNIIHAIEAQKQKDEEERRRLFASTKAKMMKIRKEKEKELIREVQRHREALAERLEVYLQEQATNEEERIAKAVAEAEAKHEKQQREKDEKKAAMLQAIAEHRAAVKQEQEHREREDKQKAVEMLNAKKAADWVFLQKKLFKAQMMKEEAKKLQDTHARQMAERRAQEELMRKQHQEYVARNAELLAEEEEMFQRYAQQVIQAASEAQRDTYPLRKAARERVAEGLVFSGVQDELTDIQNSKKRLGFTY